MYWQGQHVCDALFQTLERKRENENVLRIPKVGFFKTQIPHNII